MEDEDILSQIIAAKNCFIGHTYKEIGECLGLTREQVRGRYRHRKQDTSAASCPICKNSDNSFEVDGNYATATSTDGRIRTEQDLVAACKVDLSKWKMIRFMPGTYEAFARAREKDLVWRDGNITEGFSRESGVIIRTLFRVRGVFIRREPVPLNPIVSPIKCNARFKYVVNSAKAAGRAVIAGDAHIGFSWSPPSWKLIPFHDRRSLSILVEAVRLIRPDIVDLLGDWVDLANLSDRFAKKAAYFRTMQPTILEAHFWLRAIREASPGSQVRLHMGNHEARINKAMEAHMVEAYELKAADQIDLPPAMSIQRLLALQELGIEWIDGYPDDKSKIGQAVTALHGNIARKKEFATVGELLRRVRGNAVCGHIHRDEMTSLSFIADDGSAIVSTGYCPGCMCYTDGRVPGSHERSNWREGIGVIDYDEGSVAITHIPIVNGTAIFDGKRIDCKDGGPPAALLEEHPDYNW